MLQEVRNIMFYEFPNVWIRLNYPDHTSVDGSNTILVNFQSFLSYKTPDIEYTISFDRKDGSVGESEEEKEIRLGLISESQRVVNRFLQIFFEIEKSNETSQPKIQAEVRSTHTRSYLRRQSDLLMFLFIFWPICLQLVDSWADDRSNGAYKMFMLLGVPRLQIIFGKLVFFLIFLHLIALIFFIPAFFFLKHLFLPDIIPFLTVYVAGLTIYACLCGTLFSGHRFFAKLFFTLSLIYCCTKSTVVINPLTPFQMMVESYGEEFAYLDNFRVILFIAMNDCLLLVALLYFDVYYNSFDKELGVFYFLTKDFWKPKLSYLYTTPLPTDDQLDDKNVRIELNGVCKYVDGVWKVNKCDLVIENGEITTLYGYLGCGASEVLKMVANITVPDLGIITLETPNILTNKEPPDTVIGYSIDVPLMSYMTVMEYLRLVCELRKSVVYDMRIVGILEELDLQKVVNTPLENLSNTQRERLRIAATFVGDTKIVVLDTPLRDSLPEWRILVMKFLAKRKSGRAILMSSFDAEETELLSDQVAMMSEGYVIMTKPIRKYERCYLRCFEIGIWPMGSFKRADVEKLLELVAKVNKRMKSEMTLIETPNGKIRMIFPAGHWRKVSTLYRELENVAEKYGIVYFDVNRLNIQDVYEKACDEREQLSPLHNFSRVWDYYSNGDHKNPSLSLAATFFRTYSTTKLWKRFILCILCCLILITTRLIFDSFKSTYYSDQSMKDESGHQLKWTTYLGRGNDYPYTIHVHEEHLKHQLDLKIQTSSGDEFFKKNDTEDWPGLWFKINSKNFMGTGFSTHQLLEVISDAGDAQSKNGAKLHITASLYLIFYMFITTFILILIENKLTRKSMLIPWASWYYQVMLFIPHLFLYILLSLAIIFLVFSANSRNFHFLYLTLPSFFATWPIIYYMTNRIKHSSTVLPLFFVIFGMMLYLPTGISYYRLTDDYTSNNLAILMVFMCFLSPLTTLQVSVAFYARQDEFEHVFYRLVFLTLFHCWTFIVYLIFCLHYRFDALSEWSFSIKKWICSFFNYGYTYRAGSRIKDSFIFNQNHIDHDVGTPTTVTASAPTPTQTPIKGGQIPDRDTTEEKKKKENLTSIGSSDFTDLRTVTKSKETATRTQAKGGSCEQVTDPSKKKPPMSMDLRNDMSYITKQEEDVAQRVGAISQWCAQQSLEIKNNAVFFVGDQSNLKSALFDSIACGADDGRVVYVPYNIDNILPVDQIASTYLETVKKCHGHSPDQELIPSLLEYFQLNRVSHLMISKLRDSEKRLLIFCAKLLTRPSLVMLDSIDLFLPHSRLQTMWALCTKMRYENVAFIFTSRNSSIADKVATSVAHVYKGQFVSVTAPPVLKSKMGLIVEIGVRLSKADWKSRYNLEIADSIELSTPLPHYSRLYFENDTADTIQKIITAVKGKKKMIGHFSIRSGTLEEYTSSAVVR